LATRKPTLLYDGDCNFCRRWVGRWKALTGERVDYAPFQQAASRFPEIKPEELSGSVQLIEPEARSSGAEAVFRLLSHAPSRGWMLWAYRNVPGMAWASEGFYRTVARRRGIFSRLTTWLWGRNLEPETYHAASRLFLSLLGLIYLCAFSSLWVQIQGLVGSQGILPLEGFLASARSLLGQKAYQLLPTLCWLNPTDGFLSFLCAGGSILSLLVVLGVAPGPVLLTLWAFYLSLTTAGNEFLSFQWDILLLETGFLAVFLAPWRLWPRLSQEPHPPRLALWLLRWLLFRLMFESGCVKLLSGDPAWRELAALQVHYETQPLPTWIGWYAHQLPAWFQKLSAACMFAIELGAPFLILMPRRPRLLGLAALVFLQVLIALTGNYCFFNLLALSLCLLLLDDATLKAFLPRSWTSLQAHGSAGWRNLPALPLAAVVLWMSALQLLGLFTRGLPLGPLARLTRALEPLRIANSYGLFAVMTTSRPEIVVEGSQDGKLWLAYGFKWKPGDVSKRPGFVAPHQPRLDWQMWFAALSSCQATPWFLNFMGRLLEGKPEVLALLAKNPFPDRPPRYLRALLYDYRFTAPAERRASGAWWKRKVTGFYCPVLSLRSPG